MKLIRSVAGMVRQSNEWKSRGVRVGLVPTMGSLHEGHLSLVRAARKRVGRRGRVVVSIYVNPTQFGPQEDWARYPRHLARDRSLCRKEAVDFIFAPSDQEMYPGWDAGNYSTFVVEDSMSRPMEGVFRPAHFRGVATVVAKLFHLVQPHVAVFGAKDFQQAAVVRRMVKDLHFPVEIVVAPTVREADGLAMSSRNRFLKGPARAEGAVLWEAILEARRSVNGSARSISAGALRRRLWRLIERRPHAKVDYIEFFEPETLRPVKTVRPGQQMALAVRIGATRLIDNGPV